MQQRATLVGNKKSTKKAGKALGAGEETAALELRASLVEALVDLMSKKSFLNEAVRAHSMLEWRLGTCLSGRYDGVRQKILMGFRNDRSDWVQGAGQSGRMLLTGRQHLSGCWIGEFEFCSPGSIPEEQASP